MSLVPMAYGRIRVSKIQIAVRRKKNVGCWIKTVCELKRWMCGPSSVWELEWHLITDDCCFLFIILLIFIVVSSKFGFVILLLDLLFCGGSLGLSKFGVLSMVLIQWIKNTHERRANEKIIMNQDKLTILEKLTLKNFRNVQI